MHMIEANVHEVTLAAEGQDPAAEDQDTLAGLAHVGAQEKEEGKANAEERGVDHAVHPDPHEVHADHVGLITQRAHVVRRVADVTRKDQGTADEGVQGIPEGSERKDGTREAGQDLADRTDPRAVPDRAHEVPEARYYRQGARSSRTNKVEIPNQEISARNISKANVMSIPALRSTPGLANSGSRVAAKG